MISSNDIALISSMNHKNIFVFKRPKIAIFANGNELIEVGENLSIGFHFHIADSVEKAVSEVGEFYEENLKMFGPLRLVKVLSDQQILDIADPKLAPLAALPTMEKAVKAGAVLCGPPSLIIQQLKALEEDYPGLDRISVGQAVGTPQRVILDQLTWFSQEVMPAFTERDPASIQGS